VVVMTGAMARCRPFMSRRQGADATAPIAGAGDLRHCDGT
jgi:hypothetical protein